MTTPASAPADLDLLCLGEPLAELNQTEPTKPGFLLGHGGDTSNCAVAAARLGARVGMATRIGDDPFGRGFLELWRREGVDARAVVTDPDAPTGLYLVSHGPKGHEFAYYRAGSAASRLGPGELDGALLASTRALHVSGISQAISASACDAAFEAMATARGAGRLVSYDTNYRRSLWPPARARAVIHEAARGASILLPSLEDGGALAGIDDPDRLVDFYLGLGPGVVALTMGAEGALVATPEARLRLPAHRVEAVDATGAGDAFDGAFLAEYLRAGDPFAAGRFAAAAAALATTGFGAVAPLPTRAAVERFLTERAPDGGAPA